MSGSRAPVAVIIVTWNSAEHIETCLNSLQALERLPEEIVVVDNHSTDDTRARIGSERAGLRVIECADNLGFCEANNRGIGETTAPFVLVLNPDTRLTSAFIERLLPAFDDPRVGITCGKLLRFDATTLDSAGQQLGRSRHTIDRGYGQADTGQYDRHAEVFGACGAAALYRRAMIESIADPGGAFFDPRFFAFHEDLDVAWRAQRLGWRATYRHDAVGYHARGGSARPLRGLGRRLGMLRRSPEVRYHIVKNRYLSIVRNDRVALYLKDLPFILARDLALFGLLALTSPRVLARLWRSRGLFGEARRLGQLDAKRSRHKN